jgi:tetratricopeptide (TPR) repeat protein
MNGKERAKIEAQAEKLIKRGRLLEAIAEYQKLLSGTDQDTPIRTQMADLYVRAGQNQKAVAVFIKIAESYEQRGLFTKAIATLKRIKRLDSENLDSIKMLADLYQNQGFSSDAMREYSKLAKALENQKKPEDAIRVYETLLKLSPQDTEARTILAGLLKKTGRVEQAVEEFNAVAEAHLRKKRMKPARESLKQARELDEENPRTLTNLIDLFKREDKKKEALELIETILKKDKDNVKVLYLLGNLHLEDGNNKEAEEIFARIIALRAKEVEARVKMGRILIQRDELDKAYEMYAPLVDTLVRKQMEDKAVGLLGLILKSKKPHMPTLEKLAELYKLGGHIKNLEIIYTVLIDQYRKQNLQKKILGLLGELVELFPDNQQYYSDYRFLKGELGEFEEAAEEEPTSVKVDETQEIIESTFSKVDLYIEQGLVKNARRILDNLIMRYPDDERIAKKIEEVKQLVDTSQDEDLARKIGKVHKKETEMFDHLSGLTPRSGSTLFGDILGDDHLTAADIFAETDLIPIDMQEPAAGEKYFDLGEVITEELEAIQAVSTDQQRSESSSYEKALTDIVSDFRKVLDEKVSEDDYESHYNLGIAFMEQGLFKEAIQECQLAAKNPKLEIDSLTIIGHCYARKKEYPEAARWLLKALEKLGKESEHSYALKYELATTYEAMKDLSKALPLYEEVGKWNAEYRDISEKLKLLSSKS